MEMIDLKCKNCGGTMQPEEDGIHAVCEYCGARQEIHTVQNITDNSLITATENKKTKSRMSAGILAIILGIFGVHNFYLGYTIKGVIQLLLTVLFCWTYAVPIIVWVWALVEAILILKGKITDSKGNALSE